MSNKIIRSVEYKQADILKGILTLQGIDRFDADITFGNGSFYKDIPEPVYKFDIDPQKIGVIKSCSTKLPLKDSSLKSIVFDPPFLTYIKAARKGNGNMIMAKRFGGYWRYDELEDHYKGTIKEAARILKKKGVLVFKCQDIIHNHKMHSTHINATKWAENSGLRLKDLFILPAKMRMPMPEKEGEKKRIQKHARIFHSYFLVLEK